MSSWTSMHVSWDYCGCMSSALLGATTVLSKLCLPYDSTRMCVSAHFLPSSPRLGTVRFFTDLIRTKRGPLNYCDVYIYLGSKGRTGWGFRTAGSSPCRLRTDRRDRAGASTQPIPISGEEALGNTETASEEVALPDLLYLSVDKEVKSFTQGYKVFSPVLFDS